MKFSKRKGSNVFYLTDDVKIVEKRDRIVALMEEKGYEVDTRTAYDTLVIKICFDTKVWERGERKLLQEEALLALQECIIEALKS